MRQNVFDESGEVVGWFKLNAATKYDEGEFWDGSNHISLATGSQWGHQELYKTKGGQWVLHSWSQYQGTRPRWTYVDDDDAKDWLVKNEYENDVIEEVFGGKLPEETRVGRPAVGKQVTLRLSEETIAVLDAMAVEQDTSRAELVRDAVEQFLMKGGR